MIAGELRSRRLGSPHLEEARVPGPVVALTSQEEPRLGLLDRSPQEPEFGLAGDRTGNLEVSVIICAYTERRWEQTQAAVQSVLGQDPGPAQVLLVIDHNPGLAERARRELPAAVTVLESAGPPGLSGARNTGLAAAAQPVTVFLDDDAEARAGWLASLVSPFCDPGVVATGGSVHPRWPARRPRWLPPAFDWVVGCTYLGLPETVGPVRNPIGASMSVRTHAALDAGGFTAGMGRIGTKPQGCEETELAIRLTASLPGSTILHIPDSAVDHHVAPERLTLRYFLSRCWHEGLSKAAVVRLTSSAAGLERERRQVAVVIPLSLLRELRAFATGDPAAPARMTMIAAGLAATTAGYLLGLVRSARHRSPVAS